MPSSAVSRRNLDCRHTARSLLGWELEAMGSSRFCVELQRLRRWVGQGLGLLGRELEAPAESSGRVVVQDECTCSSVISLMTPIFRSVTP